MKKIIDIISKTNVSYKEYIFKVYLINTGGAIFIGFVLCAILGAVNIDVSDYSKKYFDYSFVYFFGSVVFSPILETFLLVSTINVIQAYSNNFSRIAIFSGLIWGLIHSFFSLFSFPMIVWEFFVMSLVYIHMGKKGFWFGYVSSLIVHVLNNFSALAFIFLIAD